MALKRLTLDHHNMHKRHFVIGDAMAVILALSKGRSSFQMAPVCRAPSAYFLASFCQVSYRWVPSEWNGADLPSRDRSLHQWRPPDVSERVEPLLAPDTVDVGAGPLGAEPAGSPASTSDAQSESELSSRELPLPARDCVGELPESEVESHARGDVAQATHPAVWAPRQESRALGTSGRPPQGLEHPSASPRAGHELQSECVRREPSVGQSRVQVPRAYAQEIPGSGRIAVPSAACNLRFGRVRSASVPSVAARRRVAPSFDHFSRRDGSTENASSGWPQWTTSLREGCPHPHRLLHTLSSRTSVVRGLSPKVGSAAVGSLRNGVRDATEEITLLLGSGAALVARQWNCTRSWSTLTCLAFGL